MTIKPEADACSRFWRYGGGWAPRISFTSARGASGKDAHKAADFIVGLDKSKPAEKAQAQLRTETSQHVADFERGSSTVNIVEKETATEHREPVPTGAKRARVDADQDAKIDEEKVLDGEVDGRKAPEDRDFERSLADADRKAKEWQVPATVRDLVTAHVNAAPGLSLDQLLCSTAHTASADDVFSLIAAVKPGLNRF